MSSNFEAFLKKVKVGDVPEGESKSGFIRIEAETEGEMDVKKLEFLGNGWTDSSKEEYDANETRAEELQESLPKVTVDTSEVPAETPTV